MEEKIYLGKGKQTNENFINGSICFSDIPKEHIYEFKGKKYFNITVAKLMNPDQYGKTHTITVNTFKHEK